MPEVRITARVDAADWRSLRLVASASNESISQALTAAIREYVARHRVRPEVLRLLEDSLREHDELGRRLSE